MTDPTLETRSSRLPRWLVGCAAVLFGGMLLLGIAGYSGWNYFMGKVDTWAQEFEDQGFNRVSDMQMQEITGQVDEKNLYVGQMVRLRGKITQDVAIIAQLATIYGEVEGTVYFRGQSLHVKGKGRIKANQGQINSIIAAALPRLR